MAILVAPKALVFLWPRRLYLTLDPSEGESFERYIRFDVSRNLLSIEVDDRLPAGVRCLGTENNVHRFQFEAPASLRIPFTVSSQEPKTARDQVCVSIMDDPYGESTGGSLKHSINIYNSELSVSLIRFTWDVLSEIRRPLYFWLSVFLVAFLVPAGYGLYRSTAPDRTRLATRIGLVSQDFFDPPERGFDDAFVKGDPQNPPHDWYTYGAAVHFAPPDHVGDSIKTPLQLDGNGFAMPQLDSTKPSLIPIDARVSDFESDFQLHFLNGDRIAWMVHATRHFGWRFWLLQYELQGEYIELKRTVAGGRTTFRLSARFCASPVDQPDTCAADGSPGPYPSIDSEINDVEVSSQLKNGVCKINLLPRFPKDASPTELPAISLGEHLIDFPDGSIAFIGLDNNQYSVTEVKLKLKDLYQE
jgi:hypothetical protein